MLCVKSPHKRRVRETGNMDAHGVLHEMATLLCVLVLLLAAATGSEAQCSGSTSRIEFTVTSVKSGTTHRDVAASLLSEVPADSQEPQPVALKVAHWTQRCGGTETVAMDISTASSILAESVQNSTVTSVSYGDDKPPKITKPTNDTLIIQDNEAIDLSCVSNELVNCTYPHYEDDEEIVKIDTKELSYVSHLQRKKAKYYHTGNYSFWKVGKEYSLNKVIVYVRAAPDSVARPIISTDHQHAVVGDNVTLSCEVTVDEGITFTLGWDVPPTSPAHKEGRVHVGRTAILIAHKDGGEMGRANITIYNIQDVDNGTYVCKVEDHVGNRNNVTFDIAVYASEPPVEL